MAGRGETGLARRLSISYEHPDGSSETETLSDSSDDLDDAEFRLQLLHNGLNKLSARMRTARDWRRMKECFRANGSRCIVNQEGMFGALDDYGMVKASGCRTGLEQLSAHEAELVVEQFFPLGQTLESFENFQGVVLRRRKKAAAQRRQQQRARAEARRQRQLEQSRRMVEEHEAIAATQMIGPARAARIRADEKHLPLYLQETAVRQRERAGSPTTVMMATGIPPVATMLREGMAENDGGGSGRMSPGEAMLTASRRPPSPLFKEYMATSSLHPRHRRKEWVKKAVRGFHRTRGGGVAMLGSVQAQGQGREFVHVEGDADPEFHKGRAALFDIWTQRQMAAIPDVPLAHRPRRLCHLDLIEGKTNKTGLAGTTVRPRSPTQRECSLFAEVAAGHADDTATLPMSMTILAEARPYQVGGLYIPQIG